MQPDTDFALYSALKKNGSIHRRIDKKHTVLFLCVQGCLIQIHLASFSLYLEIFKQNWSNIKVGQYKFNKFGGWYQQ